MDFYQKRPFLCRINAAVAIDQKCHQADRKKCKPIFHTKYFHSDQNRRASKGIGCTSKHRRRIQVAAQTIGGSPARLPSTKPSDAPMEKSGVTLSALKPDRQSQYRKEQLQNPVKHIQFSPGKCLRDQIGSKSASTVRSTPEKGNTASGIDTKPILLYGFSSTFPINCFTFCKSTANSRPVRPNKIPKRIRYVTVFVSVNDRVCERRTENFSSPSACEVADAVKDAIAAGSNAEYAILPLTTTSIGQKRLLQTESERGLPNPAAIPAINTILPLSGKWNLRANAWESVAPICTGNALAPRTSAKQMCDPCTGHDKWDECQWNRLPLSLPRLP